MDWFYTIKAQVYGPTSVEELTKWMRRKPGSVEAVWRDGMPDWIAPEYVNELVQRLRQPPPLPRHPLNLSPPAAPHVSSPIGSDFKIEARHRIAETVSSEITKSNSTRGGKADRPFLWGFGIGVLGGASNLLSGRGVYPPWNTASGLAFYFGLLIGFPTLLGLFFMLLAWVGTWLQRRRQRTRAH